MRKMEEGNIIISYNKNVFNGYKYYNLETEYPYAFDLYNKCLVIDIVVGILYLSSKQIYKTKKGEIMKTFSAFDNRFPSFLVKTKKREMNDYYVVVKMGIDKNTNKIYGSVINYIGKISDINISLKTITTCHWNNNIEKNIIKYHNIDTENERNLLEENNNWHTITVDPNNCYDIDDAIQCIKYNDYTEIRIHIADVSSYIPENSELDIELSNRIESIYFRNETINMLHHTLSTNICSLKENTIRRTFTLIIKLSNNLNDITIDNLSYKFVRTNTFINKNLSYDNINNIIQNINNNEIDNLDKSIHLIYNIGKDIGKIINNKKIEYDSHTMIENFMIITNIMAAKYIGQKENSLIRGQRSPINLSTIECVDKKLKTLHNNLQMERALYYLDSEQDNYHYGLNISKYTHFTSPIRRYADIIVHRMIDKMNKIEENNYKKLIPIIYKMNHYNKFYKEIMYLDKIINIFGENDTIELSGNVVFITENNINIYIDEYDLIVNINLIDNILKKISYIELTDKSMNISTNEEIWEIELYQKVKIKMFKIKKSYKLIKVIIIEPNIIDIFE